MHIFFLSVSLAESNNTSFKGKNTWLLYTNTLYSGAERCGKEGERIMILLLSHCLNEWFGDLTREKSKSANAEKNNHEKKRRSKQTNEQTCVCNVLELFVTISVKWISISVMGDKMRNIRD